MTTESKGKAPKKRANICGAKKRQGPGACGRPAGWGTNHVGTGRCKLHGGNNTGPKDRKAKSEAMKGNLNGLKHGGRAIAWLKVLEVDEQEAYNEETTEVIPQIEAEIRLLSIREKRMLERIKQIADQGGLIMVEKTISWGNEPTDNYIWRNGTRYYKRELTQSKSFTEKDYLSVIMAIETELTKVQDKKAKLLDLKHRVELDLGPGEDEGGENLKDYEKALNAVAEEVWNDGEE